MSACVTSTLSLSNRHRSEWTEEAGAAHYHVVKPRELRGKEQTPSGRMQLRLLTETSLTGQRVAVRVVFSQWDQHLSQHSVATGFDFLLDV